MKHAILIGLVPVVVAAGVFVMPRSVSVTGTEEKTENVGLVERFLPKEEKPEFVQGSHIKPPEAVKAIYMSGCVLATPSFRDSLVEIVDTTELNAIVIDIKDSMGAVTFETKNEVFQALPKTGCRASDVPDFIRTLHEKNIYVIGRITVFQDPLYTAAHPEEAVLKKSDGGVWKDRKGLSFIDVSAPEYRKHIVELAKETYAMGVDELNFDYIRFPSDGNMLDARFPHSENLIAEGGKPAALENFFKYLSSNLPEEAVTSADLFGMTTTNTDDLNIGQVLEKTLPYFDYIAPMVYPSHYPPGFNGWADPNNHPYDLIYFVMEEGARRAEAAGYNKTALRPWLQDFDYGGDYDAADVRAQIKATYDVGLTSWMLWAPSNKYTRDALVVQ
jgi:hypothetical protein